MTKLTKQFLNLLSDVSDEEDQGIQSMSLAERDKFNELREALKNGNDIELKEEDIE